MSALLQSAVVTNEFWYEGGSNSKRFKAVDVTLTLTGQGTIANPIAASLFGLSSIVGARDGRDPANNLIPCGPSSDGTKLLIGLPVITPGATKNIVATGLASAGNITATGVLATDTILAVTDLTTPAAPNKANFTPGAGVIAQASGAGNLSSKTLQFLLQAASSLVAAGGTTDTVRLTVVGNY